MGLVRRCANPWHVHLQTVHPRHCGLDQLPDGGVSSYPCRRFPTPGLAAKLGCSQDHAILAMDYRRGPCCHCRALCWRLAHGAYDADGLPVFHRVWHVEFHHADRRLDHGIRPGWAGIGVGFRHLVFQKPARAAHYHPHVGFDANRAVLFLHGAHRGAVWRQPGGRRGGHCHLFHAAHGSCYRTGAAPSAV